jgi:hypothetical protein
MVEALQLEEIEREILGFVMFKLGEESTPLHELAEGSVSRFSATRLASMIAGGHCLICNMKPNDFVPLRVAAGVTADLAEEFLEDFARVNPPEAFADGFPPTADVTHKFREIRQVVGEIMQLTLPDFNELRERIEQIHTVKLGSLRVDSVSLDDGVELELDTVLLVAGCIRIAIERRELSEVDSSTVRETFTKTGEALVIHVQNERQLLALKKCIGIGLESISAVLEKVVETAPNGVSFDLSEEEVRERLDSVRESLLIAAESSNGAPVH